jgi:hypothetical protein
MTADDLAALDDAIPRRRAPFFSSREDRRRFFLIEAPVVALVLLAVQAVLFASRCLPKGIG